MNHISADSVANGGEVVGGAEALGALRLDPTGRVSAFLGGDFPLERVFPSLTVGTDFPAWCQQMNVAQAEQRLQAVLSGRQKADAFDLTSIRFSLLSALDAPGALVFVAGKVAPAAPAASRSDQAPERQRTLLLVDDEENILASLRRLLRRDGYQILTATSGQAGLELLARNAVDVIVSDQRMPGMTGVEFLRQVKNTHPQTVRLVLSGYTELQSITDAINEGAIYKFLTKPWEDDLLRANIEEAFRYKEMADENLRLGSQLQDANKELAESNTRLMGSLAALKGRLERDEISLDVAQEVLQCVPFPVLGMDSDGMVVLSNGEANRVLGGGLPLLGLGIGEWMPAPLKTLLEGREDDRLIWQAACGRWQVRYRSLERESGKVGRLLILFPYLTEN